MLSKRLIVALASVLSAMPGCVQALGSADAVEPVGAGSTETLAIGSLLADRDGDTIPDRLGQRAQVRGVVTIPPGLLGGRNFQAFIQDDSGGVVLFSFDHATPLEAGDVVEVSGVVQQFRGAVQLQELQLQKVGRGELPDPEPVSVARADSWTHMGRRVRVEGIAGPVALDSSGAMRLTGDDDAVISLYFPGPVMRAIDWKQFPRGSRIAASGVISIYKHTWPYDGGFQLIISRPQDLELVALPAAAGGLPIPPWLPWAIAVAAVLLGLLLWLLHLQRSREKARQRELAMLTALSSAIGMADLSREQLAHRACDILTAYGIVDAATVDVFDQRGGLRQLAASAVDPKIAALLASSQPPAEQTHHGSGQSVEAGRQQIEARLAGHGLNLLAVHPLPSLSGSQGFLVALSPRRRRPNPMQERSLLAAVKLLALALENSTIQQRARQEQEALHQLVITDSLTQLYNRRFLDEYLRVQIPLARRRGGGLAFLTLDIDRFKAINDRWGHEVGDQVLERVASAIRQTTRSGDLPVRMGGEEFVVVVTETSLEGASRFAERLREVIAAETIDDVVPDTPLRVTVSIGVAMFGLHGETGADLLRASDEAMYASKQAGRNTVTLAATPEPTG
jgi:diguanylate cyclase (GGDEF)-like protein